VLRDELADKNSLVYCPNWEIEGMYSCCSADVIIRLEAGYCSVEDHKYGVQQAIEQQWAMRRLDGRRNNLRHLLDNCCSVWDAVPLDIMFGAVLQDMLGCGGAKTLYMCTDNTTVPERGDVHKGPFSTKRFAFWLRDQKVCQQWIQGADTGQCSTWSWQLDAEKAKALSTTLSRRYNKWHNRLADKLPNPHPHPFEDLIVW
jgi:hypothetical protein